MRLEKISFINIRHHLSRVVLLAVGLIVAVATVVALYSLTKVMDRDFQNKLDLYGSNMLVTPKSNNLKLSYNGINFGSSQQKTETLAESDIDRLKTIKNSANLAVIAPKLINVDRIKNRTVMVMGVEFSKEFRIKRWWQLDSGAKPKGQNQALVGANAAKALKLKIGNTARIKGHGFTVKGILKSTGSSEDDLIYIDLKQAQNIYYQPQQLSLLEVATWCYDCPIEQIVGQASEKLPNAKISAVLQSANRRNKVVSQFNLFSIVLSFIMATVAILIVFTSMLGAVRERRREIGIFRAIGYRRFNIIEIIVIEIILVALVSGLLGYVLGILSAKLLAPALGIDLPVVIDAKVGYFAVLGTMILAIAASVYPILSAAKMSPTTAINDI